MKTEVCDLLGIEYPIFQGGMAWTSTAELAAAVSNAGGLGILGSGNMPPEVLRKEILKTKSLTPKPFGVNIILLNNPFLSELFEVVKEEEVPIVTTGAGNPGPYISALKERGIKVIPVIASVTLAKRLERGGADALIAEGMEAGGHIGELTTFVLVPQVVAAVSIPVIAAGGIADGRGMLAAFVLGAKGVQLGTRFICAQECTVHPGVKEKILRAKDRDTIVTGYSTGHPVRILKNRLSRELERLDKENRGEEVEKMGEGKLKLAMREGDLDWGSLMAGQSAAMVYKIEPAKDIIESLVRETNSVLQSLRNFGE